MISASAPGKAVLSGEYAVLADATAIAAAVDRRARVSLSAAAGDWHTLCAPGYLEGRWPFRTGGGDVIAWQDPGPGPSAFSLVEEIWRPFDSSAWPAMQVVIDTQAFTDPASGLKLGFGSSAAVAVALTAALRRKTAQEDDGGEMAREAHDRFQGGRGSGVDIATSCRGGLIAYRRRGAESRRIDWPAGLQYRYLWSGQAAATRDKLGKLQHVRDDALQSLCILADRLADDWLQGDASRILDAYGPYIDALGQFSADHDLGIFDAGHEELVRQAPTANVVYKPCGAGGGDIGIVLASCEHDIEAFCDRARQSGFSSLDIALEDAGLEFEE